jgi:hypothetical protein
MARRIAPDSKVRRLMDEESQTEHGQNFHPACSLRELTHRPTGGTLVGPTNSFGTSALSDGLAHTVQSASDLDSTSSVYGYGVPSLCTNLPSTLELIMSMSEQVVTSFGLREPTSR